MQLRHLRDQSKQLESRLHGLQNDFMCEERELNVLKTSLQQTSLEDSQYVRVWLYSSIKISVFVALLCSGHFSLIVHLLTFGHLEFVAEVHRRTLDRSCQYTVLPADGRFVLQAPIVF